MVTAGWSSGRRGAFEGAIEAGAERLDAAGTVNAMGRYRRLMAIMSRRCGRCPGGLDARSRAVRSPADPARLAIIGHLAAGEARVVDVTGELGLAQSTASAHLACLRDCGLVDARRPGRASVYSLRQPALPALPGLLAAAQAVLAATGNAVALCPHYGQAR
jgi:ArsR family transcriptional regulator, cadmium/lead-responsive transcriptional repressor